MRIPSRHVAKPEPVEQVKEVVRDDSPAIIAEVKKVLDIKRKPVKYVFSILRDSDGLMTEVVATPVDFDTIL